jgi:hypothetical protein
MEYSIEAQVIDSRHLKLKRPIEIAPGSTVMITIEHAESVSEAQQWYMLSSQGLEEAYGEDEPEYSLDMIKAPNPDYQS